MLKRAARKKQRLLLIVTGLTMLAISLALVLTALQDQVTFFYGPTEISQKAVKPGIRFRLGGIVAAGSIVQTGTTTSFIVTDLQEAVSVQYTGLLPDLFREGQGVVAQGTLQEEGVFVAEEVLAKHDETYMPPEVVEAMKRAGTWKPEDGPLAN